MPKKSIAFYDDSAYNYQKYWFERQYENESEKICLKRLFKLIPQKQTLADIGGGFGRLVPEYANEFSQCLLVDPSERLLKEAQQLCRKYKNLKIKKGFVENLPIENQQFDVALLIRTFHHLEDPQKAIKEIYRILKPNGFLILEFPNKIHFKNCLKAIFRLDFSCFNQEPEDISSEAGVVPFLNYHPKYIKNLLKESKFKIIKIFSVSNFRNPLFKKLIPLRLLLWKESAFSLLTSYFSPLCYFGPSIFILARKSIR